jgi:hypothetical protein
MVMTKKIRLYKTVSGLIRITAASLLAFILLLLSFVANTGLTSPHALAAQNDLPPLAWQGTVTATATFSAVTPTSTVQLRSGTIYTFSLASLGYDVTTLSGPLSTAQYSFRVPENWTIDADGELMLDLSYIYSQLGADTNSAAYGSVTVSFDGETMEIFSVDEDRFDHQQLRIALPVELLNNRNRNQHIIEVTFDDKLLCAIPHEAELTIHPESTIALPYKPGPLTLDLSLYPRPFFQRAFEADQVRFVLPSVIGSKDLSYALPIAAKLGNLTNNRLAISATQASSLTASVPFTLNEHLIVVGQPQDNQLLPLLSQQAELPVSLHQRQLELVSRGPTMVAPGGIFTYTFAVTNTGNQAMNLNVISALSHPAELMNCQPECQENTTDQTVTWSSADLAPQKSLTLSLTLKAGDSLTNGLLENTVTVLDANLGPLNADTLITTLATDAAGDELQTSSVGADGYFFMYNGQAVAREDGIVQEVASPWGEGRAILVVTGLSDEALKKASQAMSSEIGFPSMSGPVALVREALSPSEIASSAILTDEVTLADLGYEDAIIGGKSSPQIQYTFETPYSWQLTDAASLDLYFTHAQLADFAGSGMTVLMNRTPIGGVILSDETANDGHLQVSLADAGIQPGENNRLTIQATTVVTGGGCSTANNKDAFWLRVKNSSKLLLTHEENTPDIKLDLKNYPFPFNFHPDLSNVMVALPNDPSDWELEAALRLVASLGSSVSSKTIIPAGLVGDDISAENLANYQIVAIGRPSRHPLIQQVNDQLPQPFLPGSDEIEQRLDDVVLRLPRGVSLSYVQLLASPWNEANALLVLTGTTDEAVQRAVQAVIRQARGLRGDLALLTADNVTTLDTRKLTGRGTAAAIATAVPEMTAAPTATAKAAPTSTPANQNSLTPEATTPAQPTATRSGMPNWVIPLVGINGLIVLGIFAFIFWQTRYRRL